MSRIKLGLVGIVLSFGLVGCIAAPVVQPTRYIYTQPVSPPPNVVYVQPSYAAPAGGFNWVYHPRYGWGWYHPHEGWHRGWR